MKSFSISSRVELDLRSKSEYTELLLELESCSNLTRVLMFNLSIKHICTLRFWKIPRDRRHLFLVEPRIVHPLQYSRIWLMFFKHVYRVGGQGESEWQTRYVDVQDIQNLDTYWKSRKTRNSIAHISSNKISFVPGENYLLRAEIIRAGIEAGHQITLAGRGWQKEISSFQRLKTLVFQIPAINLKPVSSWHRTPHRILQPCLDMNQIMPQRSTIEFLRVFDIAIVVENESTYVSEKLTDALLAGCKILYVGPDLESLGFRFSSFPLIQVGTIEEAVTGLDRLKIMTLNNDFHSKTEALQLLNFYSKEKLKQTAIHVINREKPLSN